MIGLIGKKLGHTRVYDANGVANVVTVVLAGPNRVLQVKTPKSDGYSAVQLAFGDQKPQRISKAKLGHLKKFATAVEDKFLKPAGKKALRNQPEGEVTPLTAVQKIKEFRNFAHECKPGDLLGVNLFKVGDYVDVIGVTKGRGFEGVMKRHGFRGGDSTHGSKGWHRRPGAIGQRLFPGTVMRGMKMPGHMGQVQRTVQNLAIVQVRDADNLLLIRGGTPGSEGDYVIVREAKKRSRAFEAQRKVKAEKRASERKSKGKGGAAKPGASAAKK